MKGRGGDIIRRALGGGPVARQAVRFSAWNHACKRLRSWRWGLAMKHEIWNSGDNSGDNREMRDWENVIDGGYLSEVKRQAVERK